MAKEIERKFLVDIDKCRDFLINGVSCRQGYISKDVDCTVRVRIIDDKGFLTLKSKTIGISREEFEYNIPLEDARFMLNHFCEGKIIQKTRFVLSDYNPHWLIDVFEADNQGLILAEVELDDENQNIDMPTWVKEEVTSQRKYYNSQLAANPYNKWK